MALCAAAHSRSNQGHSTGYINTTATLLRPSRGDETHMNFFSVQGERGCHITACNLSSLLHISTPLWVDANSEMQIMICCCHNSWFSSGTGKIFEYSSSDKSSFLSTSTS